MSKRRRLVGQAMALYLECSSLYRVIGRESDGGGQALSCNDLMGFGYRSNGELWLRMKIECLSPRISSCAVIGESVEKAHEDSNRDGIEREDRWMNENSIGISDEERERDVKRD